MSDEIRGGTKVVENPWITRRRPAADPTQSTPTFAIPGPAHGAPQDNHRQPTAFLRSGRFDRLHKAVWIRRLQTSFREPSTTKFAPSTTSDFISFLIR
jgi:hypothetical protein